MECVSLFCGPKIQAEKLAEKVEFITSMELFSFEEEGKPILINFSDLDLKFNSSKALKETKIIREK